MIIKVTGMQARAPARVGRRPPPPPKKTENFFWLYWGPFCYFLFIWGPFCYVFLILGAFSQCGGLLLLFTSWCSGLFWACPPPTKISAGAHDCKEGSRACSPEIFLCDRNLLSSGPVLLQFCLKNDKSNDKL